VFDVCGELGVDTLVQLLLVFVLFSFGVLLLSFSSFSKFAGFRGSFTMDMPPAGAGAGSAPHTGEKVATVPSTRWLLDYVPPE
jgi:hypothetical protein